jgi:hypothetical protein
MEMHAPKILATHPPDASTPQWSVTITAHVPPMFVTRPPEIASTLLLLFLHLQILAPSLLVTARTEFTLILKTVMTTMHAPLILAILQT